MIRIYCLIFIAFTFTSCDNFGSTKVKNLIDLTSRLSVEENTPIILQENTSSDLVFKDLQTVKFSKNKIISKPVIARKTLYTLDDQGNISAYSIKTKQLLWNRKLNFNNSVSSFNSGEILYSNDRLYVVNGTKYLIIIDAKNGREIVRKKFPDILRARPVMTANGILIAQTIDSQVFAYDINKAKFIWFREGGAQIITNLNHMSPVNIDGNVLINFHSGELLLFSSKTGQVNWGINLAKESANLSHLDPVVVVSQPIIDRDHIYFATSNARLMKVQINNGKIIWSKTVEDVQSISLSGKNLLITTNARQLAILSSINGKVKWVGDLITQSERSKKRPKTTLMQAPIVSKETATGKLIVSVINSNGELYQVSNINGKMDSDNLIVQSVVKNINHYWVSCCNQHIHLFANNTINFKAD